MRRFLFLLCLFLAAILLIAFAVVSWFRKSAITVDTSHPSVIKQIKSLNRLETASYTIEKIIEAGTNDNAFKEFLYGDRILLIAHGQVIAGIDLSKVTEKDIETNGTVIRLTLPPPQILITSLDNEKTRVYDRKQGLFTKGNKDLEAQARSEAEKSIRASACEGNILATASENARKQLTALLSSLGYSTITIEIPSATCS